MKIYMTGRDDRKKAKEKTQGEMIPMKNHGTLWSLKCYDCGMRYTTTEEY
jgi:hypothetical protein